MDRVIEFMKPNLRGQRWRRTWKFEVVIARVRAAPLGETKVNFICWVREPIMKSYPIQD